jgi:predicted ATPase with chaperone activity
VNTFQKSLCAETNVNVQRTKHSRIQGKLIGRGHSDDSSQKNVEVYPVATLAEMARALAMPSTLAPLPCDLSLLQPDTPKYAADFMDVKGHAHVKRALEVAAAGGHNLLLSASGRGEPGPSRMPLSG